MLELRGRGLIGEAHMGTAYWQDHLPVREAPMVAGHAVRQMYLDCGVVDAATELGDGRCSTPCAGVGTTWSSPACT